MAKTTTAPSHLTPFTQNHSFNSPPRTTISFWHRPTYPPSFALPINCHFVAPSCKTLKSNCRIVCKATEVSLTEESPSSGGENWVPVVPLTALPKGERRVIIQDGETILLLWYKDQVYAIENRSPAEGAYTEGLLNAKLTQFLWALGLDFDGLGDILNALEMARKVREMLLLSHESQCIVFASVIVSLNSVLLSNKRPDSRVKVDSNWIYLTSVVKEREGRFIEVNACVQMPSMVTVVKDGCIVCPSTDSTFDLRTGAIKEWYPNNPVLRVLTPALRTLFVYPVKTDEENIYISIRGGVKSDVSAEIVFSGKAQPGVTASDVNVDEVRMVIDEGQEGFGFTRKNELINGQAAIIGFLFLIDFELLTGKGLLKGTGFLDFLYAASNAFN
ncbi:hypothetical protein POTOM_059341 [Populus tomentosa]|uniref:Rieske domain-containing protein n=1 Tax=Populus tomentosa TaxID=118781 RepID=A0A8X8BWH8_POPTO|nr:hypothetical protein POTOM_059341 [Populus tomentosa]